MASWLDSLDQEQLENANLIVEEAKKAGISPNLAVAMAMRESSLRHQSGDSIVRSPKGAMGIMQLMPKTAEDLNVDPEDKAQNIRGGINYIKQMLNQFDNDPMLAAAAYNHGPGGSFFKGGELPEETKEFLKAIKEHGGFDVPAVTEGAPEAQEEPVSAWEAAPASGYGNLSKGIVAGGGALAGALAAGTGSAISGVAQSAARTAGEAMARRLMEEGRASSASAVPEVAAALQGMKKSEIPIGTTDAGRMAKGQTGVMPYNYAKSAGLTDIEAGLALDMTKQEGGVHDLATKRREALMRLRGSGFAENPAYGGLMTPTASAGGGPRASFVAEESGLRPLPPRQSIPTTPKPTPPIDRNLFLELVRRNPQLASGLGRVLSGGLGGFGGAMGGMEALERYQQGDVPGAALAGTGALASLGMIPAATAPIAAPAALLSGLGLGGYDLYKRYKEASKEGEKWARRHPPTEAELKEAARPYFGKQRYVSGSDLP